MKKIKSLLSVLALSLLLALALGGSIAAEDVSNFKGIYTVDAGTAHSLAGADTFTSTATRVDGWGSILVQVVQDSDGSATIVYHPQVAVDGTYYGTCASVTNWADLTEQVVVANAATPASSRVASTTNTIATDITATLAGSTTGVITIPYVTDTTFNYATVAATTASVSVVEVDRNMTVANDAVEARRFDLGGAYCVRIIGTSTTTETITSTITIAPVDVY